MFEKIQKTELKQIGFIIFFTISLFAFAYFTCTPRTVPDDDWGIANYFAGAMGSEFATPYNKFVNIAIGWLMYVIYKILPGLNWFIVIQEAIVVFSCALLQYMLICKMKKQIDFCKAFILTSIILLSFELTFLCLVQFSQTTAIGCTIGGLWILFSYEKKNKIGIIFGIAFTIFCALFRTGIFEMIFLILSICIGCYLIEKTRKINPKKIIISLFDHRYLIGIYISILVVCLFAIKVNQDIYNSKYYKGYNQFNSARAALLDYPRKPYSEISDELSKIGVSENDYDLITSWAFADRSFITSELLQKITKISCREVSSINYKREITKYFKSLLIPQNNYNKLLYFVIGLSLICIIIDPKRMIWQIPSIGLVVLFIELYLTVYVQRYPTYIRSGLLFSAISVVLFLTDWNKLNIIIYYFVGISFLVLSLLGDSYYLDTKGTFRYNLTGLKMYKYLNSRYDDIFFVPTHDTVKLPSIRNSYNIFWRTDSGIFRHIVGLGGWSTNNPWVNEVYSSWGIDYPMRQIADDDVFLISSFNFASKLQKYVLEHDNKETSLSLTAVEYGTTIYKATNIDFEEIKISNSGKINKAFYCLDSEYDTTDITIEFIIEKKPIEHESRVFLTLAGDDGKTRYYMVYNGNNMILKTGKNIVIAKIPRETIDMDQKYMVNVLLQSGTENILITDKAFEL